MASNYLPQNQKKNANQPAYSNAGIVGLPDFSTIPARLGQSALSAQANAANFFDTRANGMRLVRPNNTPDSVRNDLQQGVNRLGSFLTQPAVSSAVAAPQQTSPTPAKAPTPTRAPALTQTSPRISDKYVLGDVDRNAPKPLAAKPAPNQPQAAKPSQPATGSQFQASDTGLPYQTLGNQVNFTNPDGTGQGTITGSKDLANRMNDGKGSLSVMKLESPYGPGGKPQVDPQAALRQQLMQQAATSPNAATMDIGQLLATRAAQKGAQAALGLDQSQQRINNDLNQSQFANDLATQELGYKKTAAEAEGQNNMAKLALDTAKLEMEQGKGLSSITKGQIEEALAQAQLQGKFDHPDVQGLLALYHQLYPAKNGFFVPTLGAE